MISGLTTATIFTVTAANATGCSASDTVQVTVYPQAPTPSITASGPLSFCPGGSVTLTSSSTAFPNYWSTGETTNSITVSTTQTVSVYSSDAFCPSGRAYVDMLRFDTVPPLINVSGGGLTLCDGSRDLLSDGAPRFVAWNWNTSATTQQITINSPGTYAVAATDTNGCVTHADITFVPGVAPLAPVISSTSPLTVCNNEYVTITSDITDGITWSPTFDNTQSNAYNLSPPGVYDFFVMRDSLGCMSESNHLVFTVNPNPEIYTFSPADSACTGDLLTLNGSGLSNVSAVSFNSTPATGFTVIDDYTIQVTVPPGATSGGITLTDGSTGCAGVSPLFNLKSVCGANLQLSMLIQGYYSGGSMSPNLFNSGVSANPGDCDSVQVCLMDPLTNAEVKCASGVLQTDGSVALSFSNTGSYYLKVNHHSALQTWSAGPVNVNGSSAYDFTSDNLQSFGPNMVEVESGRWAFWNGDINQDELIEASDYLVVENDVAAFQFGYLATDLSGDGLVEATDYSLIENNMPFFLFSAHP